MDVTVDSSPGSPVESPKLSRKRETEEVKCRDGPTPTPLSGYVRSVVRLMTGPLVVRRLRKTSPFHVHKSLLKICDCGSTRCYNITEQISPILDDLYTKVPQNDRVLDPIFRESSHQSEWKFTLDDSVVLRYTCLVPPPSTTYRTTNLWVPNHPGDPGLRVVRMDLNSSLRPPFVPDGSDGDSWWHLFHPKMSPVLLFCNVKTYPSLPVLSRRFSKSYLRMDLRNCRRIIGEDSTNSIETPG